MLSPFTKALLICLILLSSFSSTKADERPNIIIILCDDLGYGDLSCYGNEVIRTPNIDKLASEGIRFTSFYSSSPVCSPSRVGLMTGRTPNRAGVYDWIPGGNRMHMSKNEFITVLKARHVELDLAIEHESNRPLPDGLVVQMLKRQKLRIKDKLYRLSAA